MEIPSLGSKKAKSVKEKIHNLKIGKIGTHPDGFDTCKYDQKKLFGLCGITVDEIDIDTFLNNSKNIKSEEIEPTLNKLKKTISSIIEVNQKELILSLKLEKSLKKLKEDGTYNAFAIRCWPEMFTEYGGAICAPASMLTENKVPCACEADVYGAVTQLILQEVSGQSVFLTDIVDIDLDDNTTVILKCFRITKTADKAAQSLFRVHGFWGELYVGRERRIVDLDLARKLLNAQLRMLISEVKWPRAPPGARRRASPDRA